MTDDLRDFYATCGIPKTYRAPKTPTPLRKTAKSREDRDRTTAIRDYCRGRERWVCRCCRARRGESMHEIVPRSLGGKQSRVNSIWVCGELGNGPECHGQLQRREIDVLKGPMGAEGDLRFVPLNEKSADWLKVKLGESVESPTMWEMETAE